MSYHGKSLVNTKKPGKADLSIVKNPKLKKQDYEYEFTGPEIGVAPTAEATSGKVVNVVIGNDPYMREKAKEFRQAGFKK